jgi:hypothetical protein
VSKTLGDCRHRTHTNFVDKRANKHKHTRQRPCVHLTNDTHIYMYMPLHMYTHTHQPTAMSSTEFPFKKRLRSGPPSSTFMLVHVQTNTHLQPTLTYHAMPNALTNRHPSCVRSCRQSPRTRKALAPRFLAHASIQHSHPGASPTDCSTGHLRLRLPKQAMSGYLVTSTSWCGTRSSIRGASSISSFGRRPHARG